MASVEPPNNLPDDPAPEELTARFLVDGRHFREDKGQVKARAFQPARDNRTSVFRVAGLDEKGIWNIGDIHVAPRRNRPILGRAELTVGEITSVGLRLEPDNQPYRHANIAGWPPAKDEQKSLAQELAANARLRARSETA